MPTETQREQNKMLSSLLKVQHGELAKFYDDAIVTARDEPNLFAHTIAWNHKNGRVRDSKVAFPVVALRTDAMVIDRFAANAVAHLAMLGPRDLVRAYEFSKLLSANGNPIRHRRRRLLEAALNRYLAIREQHRARWDATVVRNRRAMKQLYAITHRKPNERVQRILFDRDYPRGTVFEKLAKLHEITPEDAAMVIAKYRLPLTVVVGAGVKLDHPNVLLAMIESMTVNELVTAANMFSKFDSWKLPLVQEAYNETVGKRSKDKRSNVGKATRAKRAAPHAAKALAKAKEAAADSLKKVEGDWLVLADRSPSMRLSIEAGKQLAALLAHRVTGKVHLVFFDARPIGFDVTGRSLDDIEAMTEYLGTGSATSIGCGLRWLRDHKHDVDGIVVVSDGEENTAPHFHEEYQRLGNEPAIYYVQMRGGMDNLSRRLSRVGIPFTQFDVRDGFDYNAMSNVVNVLKPTTYGFLEEVMETPLKTLDDVFRKEVNAA